MDHRGDGETAAAAAEVMISSQDARSQIALIHVPVADSQQATASTGCRCQPGKERCQQS